MSDPPPTGTPTDLTGWKDVATYLGRSVRTVQRWEKDLGLPVHRVRTQAGEVIYARRRDLNAWLTSRRGQMAAATQTNGEENAASAPAAEGPRQRVSPPWVWAGVLLLGLLAMASLLADRATGVNARKAQPGSWAVEDGALAIRDTAGRLLWTHRFDFPLDADLMNRSSYAYGDTAASFVALEDIDGDHATEVLAIPLGRTPARQPPSGRLLHCFESDGRLRFIHQIRRSVRFGHETFGPPFVDIPPLAVRSGRRASIWLPSLHSPFFPSVVQKLTPTGEVTGEYWQAGYPTTMSEVERGGRRFLVVGGTRNEDFSAALSVLRADDPTSTAPANDERYRCLDCPERAPAVFLSFPRLEIGRLAGHRAVVTALRENAGRLLVQVTYVPPRALGDCGATGYYRLDERFHIASANLDDDYTVCHAGLRLQGRLDHDLGPRDLAEMFPVRAWYDGVPELVVRPAFPPSAPTVSR